MNEPSLGATVLWSELYWAQNLDRAILPADPVSFGRNYREFGLYAGITQDLGPHLQAGVRYDFYNPDADSVNTVMGAIKPTAFAYQTVAFAAALRWSSGRLIAEYDLNRNHNGRDAEGNPVNLPSNSFTFRGRGELLRRAVVCSRSARWRAWRPDAAPAPAPSRGVTALSGPRTPSSSRGR